MLLLPAGDTELRLLSIDPGVKNLGVSLIVVDLVSGLKRVVFSYTLISQKYLPFYGALEETYTERSQRLLGLSWELTGVIRHANPHMVVSESPYMGQFADAFAALVQALMMIEQVVNEFNVFMPLNKIDPATVKKTIGVSGKSSDKELILPALLKQKDLAFDSSIDVYALDEHARDSVAVGYSYLKTIHGI